MDLQDLFSKIFAEPASLQHYHAEINHAGSITVEPWLDDKRTVRFTQAVQLPAVIKKAIGVSSCSLGACCVNTCANLPRPGKGARHAFTWPQVFAKPFPASARHKTNTCNPTIP